jgi:hypothetical protein
MTYAGRYSTVLVVLATSLFAAPSFADAKFKFSTDLSGYNETASTLNSPASGTFVAIVSKDETQISYTLTFEGLATPVQQAHIHFGRPGLTGGVALFLCSNLGNGPAGTPACPQSGTVTGTLTSADLVGPAAQGIDPGAAGFAQIIKALRNGAAYANVHSTRFPGGEIRGPLGRVDDDDGEDD